MEFAVKRASDISSSPRLTSSHYTVGSRLRKGKTKKDASCLQYALFEKSIMRTNRSRDLVNFDLGPSGFDLLLDLFRLFFGDPFLDRLGSTFHQGFRFGQS
jgi:hypothetical protein